MIKNVLSYIHNNNNSNIKLHFSEALPPDTVNSTVAQYYSIVHTASRRRCSAEVFDTWQPSSNIYGETLSATSCGNHQL